MTESNTEQGESNTEQPQQQPQQRAARSIAAQPTRFAVYDETHKRFIGGVHDSKADATRATKSGPQGHKLVVREV